MTQCSLLVFYSEDGASVFLRNVITHLQDYTDHSMTTDSYFRWIWGSYSGATPYSSERVRRFGEAYRICLQGRRGS